MNRKSFIRYTSAIAPFIVTFNPLMAAQKRFLEKLVEQATKENRVLVLIQLNGGNDSLNTIIPLRSYKLLTAVRKNVLIPENKILRLRDTNEWGFHPAIPGLQKLYDDKLLSIVHGVSYPNPDQSHFKGINIKLTGNTKADSSKSGWVGRYLAQEYPGFVSPAQTPYTFGPPCMRVGEVALIISHGDELDYSVGINSIPEDDMSGPNIGKDPVSDNLGGKTVSLIRDIYKQAEMFAPVIKTSAKRQKNLSKMYPEESKNLLADQLKIVARLIGGGLQSRVYVVNQNGYDTHANQVDKADPTKGRHTDLLANLSEAIAAFEDDLHLMGKQDDVLGMTFSEFGRRINSDGSYGTDHGTGESVILFGTKLKHRMIGAEPEHDILPTDKNIPMQHDFRALYASVLSGWFGVPDEKMAHIIEDGATERLEIFTS